VIVRTLPFRVLTGAALALLCAFGAAAQPPGQAQPSGMMQGIGSNRDQPVRIESNSLEVRDKSRQATFSGAMGTIRTGGHRRLPKGRVVTTRS